MDVDKDDNRMRTIIGMRTKILMRRMEIQDAVGMRICMSKTRVRMLMKMGAGNADKNEDVSGIGMAMFEGYAGLNEGEAERRGTGAMHQKNKLLLLVVAKYSTS